MNVVDDEYIPTLKINLAYGRNFSDSNPSDKRRSVIINEAFAKEYGWTDAVGKKLPGKNFEDHEIIGVVNDFHFESTTHWEELNVENLKKFQLVIWLNDFPKTPEQRAAFENYMTHGGAWLGFHVSAYNDDSTHWPWFVDFLGGAVFYGNNWPPLPAKLIVDDRTHPVTRGLPATFMAPANEWYIWKPSPRLNKDVRVLLTLDPSNYPIGLKDTITGGDLPVVWTNTRYRMLYMNMGHGDKIFTNSDQNRLFENAIRWLRPR